MKPTVPSGRRHLMLGECTGTAGVRLTLTFLGYLFVFSAAALPLLEGAGAGFRATLVTRLAALSSRTWGLAAMGLPIVVIRVALNARFPVYLDWSDTLVWFTFFLYGWLFMADHRFRHRVEAQASGWLAVGCIGFGMMLDAYAGGYLLHWVENPAYSWDYELFQVFCALHTWAWVLGILGLGLRCLNFSNPWLNYAGEAVLPFYILHQPVILTMGAIVVQWPIAIFPKFLAIAIPSILMTALLVEIVRRSTILRNLFGMRQVRPLASAAGASYKHS